MRARLGWKGLKAEEYVPEGHIFLSTPNIKDRSIDFDRVNYITQFRYDESPEIKLRVGDVLLAKDGSTLGTVNVVRALPRSATVNSSIAVISPFDALEGIFLYYLFQSSFMSDEIEQAKGGMGVPHLFQSDLNKFYLPLPPREEQRAVAAFLDNETAKIDALVAEQRRLIELLKEKRQAVISDAVTKGLNPRAAMRPSGVQWLGDVPAHWVVQPLKWLTPTDRQIMYGIVLPGPNVENGIPIVKGGDVKPERLNPATLSRTTREIESGYVRSRLRGGDIVYAIRGSIGEAAIVPEELRNANITQDAARIAPAEGVDVKWLLFALQSPGVFAQLEQTVNGATIRGINIFQLKRARIPTPPPDEQAAIAAFLEESADVIDALVQEANLAISLLQERRTALISAAVTGKIDVRGVVRNEGGGRED